ncbi:hypothetical protein [Arthrobacter woluwensis]|uniref:hypothetical protein n=1 Tax=Arthrobacter woluwensis TaxID=156980 RepID=UPI00380EAC22
MTLTWPRPVILVEADINHASSILPGWFRAELPAPSGILGLAELHQQGHLTTEAVLHQAIALRDSADQGVITGFPGPGPAQSAAASWSALGEEFSALEDAGIDVIVDLGRLQAADPRFNLLNRADSVAICAIGDLPGLWSLRSRLGEIRDRLNLLTTEDRLGLIVRESATPGQRYSDREVKKSLGVDVWGGMHWDPRGAAVFSHGASQTGLSSKRFPSAAGALGTTIRETTARRRNLIGTAGEMQT